MKPQLTLSFFGVHRGWEIILTTEIEMVAAERVIPNPHPVKKAGAKVTETQWTRPVVLFEFQGEDLFELLIELSKKVHTVDTVACTLIVKEKVPPKMIPHYEGRFSGNISQFVVFLKRYFKLVVLNPYMDLKGTL